MNRPTHADVILKMLDKGANRNWVNRLAHESGIDYDNHYDIREPDEFNKHNEE
jgi:hypothetical protein